MKKYLLIMTLLFLCSQSFASVAVEQTTDPEYVINSGFSEALAEDMVMLKNRVNGEPIEPLYEKSNNKFVKAWRYFHSYLDPSIENDYERYHHNIKLNPSFTDL